MKRIHSLAAWGFLGGVTLAMTPSGCASTLETAPIRGRENSGIRVPGMTEERLRQCVVDYAPELAGYTHLHVDATVEVNDEGRTLDVTTTGNPASSRDFGKCTTEALQDMDVSVSVLQALREKLEEKQTGSQQKSGGNLVGHPIVIVVAGVTIVLSDVAIQAAGITVLFTVTMALDEAVDALRRRPKWMNDCQAHLNACLASDLGSKWGRIMGSSRCKWCWEACRHPDKKSWPAEIELYDGSRVSCQY